MPTNSCFWSLQLTFRKVLKDGLNSATFPCAGVFGKKGEIQSILCLAYGAANLLYTGTLSGDIYKWKENNLLENIDNAHSVSGNFSDTQKQSPGGVL